MLGLKDASQAPKVLREMAISVLNDLRDLPAKVTDPHWLERVEENGEPLEQERPLAHPTQPKSASQ
jgi:hypothetical protein